MIARALLLISALVVAAGCLTVFEAASQTRTGLALLATSRTSDDASVKEKILAHALDGLHRSWAHPLAWHAGAAEAASALYAERALVTGKPEFFDASAEQAAHAVRLASVQVHSWTRLAAVAAMGRAHEVCDVETCLARSFASARMTDPETACARLQLAHQAGETIAPQDQRLLDYAKSGARVNDIAACLRFLPPETVFPLLLRAQ